MKTFDIHEAAEFLKIDRSTALDLAGTGQLPGAKIGRAWVFLEDDLVAYLQDKVRRQTNERREGSGAMLAPGDVVLANARAARRRRGRPLPLLPDVPTEEATRAEH